MFVVLEDSPDLSRDREAAAKPLADARGSEECCVCAKLAFRPREQVLYDEFGGPRPGRVLGKVIG